MKPKNLLGYLFFILVLLAFYTKTTFAVTSTALNCKNIVGPKTAFVGKTYFYSAAYENLTSQVSQIGFLIRNSNPVTGSTALDVMKPGLAGNQTFPVTFQKEGLVFNILCKAAASDGKYCTGDTVGDFETGNDICAGPTQYSAVCVGPELTTTFNEPITTCTNGQMISRFSWGQAGTASGMGQLTHYNVIFDDLSDPSVTCSKTDPTKLGDFCTTLVPQYPATASLGIPNFINVPVKPGGTYTITVRPDNFCGLGGTNYSKTFTMPSQCNGYNLRTSCDANTGGTTVTLGSSAAFNTTKTYALSAVKQGQTATVTGLISSNQGAANEDSTLFTPIDSSGKAWVGTGQSTTASYTGLKFTGLNLPAGAVVSSARVEFKPSADTWIKTDFGIYAEKSTDPKDFSATLLPSKRTLTTLNKKVSEDVRWFANNTYSYDVTDPVREAVSAGSLTNVALILKGQGAQWGRKYVLARSTKLVIAYSVPNTTFNAVSTAVSAGDVRFTAWNPPLTIGTYDIMLLERVPSSTLTVTLATFGKVVLNACTECENLYKDVAFLVDKSPNMGVSMTANGVTKSLLLHVSDGIKSFADYMRTTSEGKANAVRLGLLSFGSSLSTSPVDAPYTDDYALFKTSVDKIFVSGPGTCISCAFLNFRTYLTGLGGIRPDNKISQQVAILMSDGNADSQTNGAATDKATATANALNSFNGYSARGNHVFSYAFSNTTEGINTQLMQGVSSLPLSTYYSEHKLPPFVSSTTFNTDLEEKLCPDFYLSYPSTTQGPAIMGVSAPAAARLPYKMSFANRLLLVVNNILSKLR